MCCTHHSYLSPAELFNLNQEIQTNIPNTIYRGWCPHLTTSFCLIVTHLVKCCLSLWSCYLNFVFFPGIASNIFQWLNKILHTFRICHHTRSIVTLEECMLVILYFSHYNLWHASGCLTWIFSSICTCFSLSWTSTSTSLGHLQSYLNITLCNTDSITSLNVDDMYQVSVIVTHFSCCHNCLVRQSHSHLVYRQHHLIFYLSCVSFISSLWNMGLLSINNSSLYLKIPYSLFPVIIAGLLALYTHLFCITLYQQELYWCGYNHTFILSHTISSSSISPTSRITSLDTHDSFLCFRYVSAFSHYVLPFHLFYNITHYCNCLFTQLSRLFYYLSA